LLGRLIDPLAARMIRIDAAGSMTSFFIDDSGDRGGTAGRAGGRPGFSRQSFAALGFLLLVGCAAPSRSDDAGPAAATVVPRLAEHEIVTPDGAHLPLRVWLPRGRVKAVILALHGFNDYSNAFAIPAEALAWRGIATYAYDQRGFGAAPLHGSWPGRAQLAEDLVTASRLVRQAHPGVPLYLLGESMGGAVVAVAMTGESRTPPPEADGIILVAPAVWGWQTMGLFERSALWAGAHLLPSLTVSGRGIIRVEPSDNVAMLRAFSRDPLVIKETRIDTIYGLVDLMAAAYRSGPKLDAPLLYLYGDRDEVVPRAPTEQMIESLPEAARSRQRIAWYANGYHMLLRDLGGAAVVSDIASWIGARSAPLPSGADRYAETVLGGSHLAKLSEARPAAAISGLPKAPPLR
jgi:acylglycerol lipase